VFRAAFITATGSKFSDLVQREPIETEDFVRNTIRLFACGSKPALGIRTVRKDRLSCVRNV
jgi:hypothetical protein